MLPQCDLSGNSRACVIASQRAGPELIVLRIADRLFF
jgi:hypothetical protein